MRAVLRTARAAIIAAEAVAVGISLYESAVMVAGRSREPRVPAPPPRLPRFALMICARNEERVVGGILETLLRQDYPTALFDVFLVAHNCTDGTADVARRLGAWVIDATDTPPGKVEAMRLGLDAIGDGYDFIGVFDADSRVPQGFLRAAADATDGEQCIQIETVPHRTDDWLATGYGLGRRARNLFWWQPRARLGMGTTVSGSGYFVRTELFREILKDAHTMTEDLELTAGLYARGERVSFVSTTTIEVEEPHRFGASLRQRSRWVRGHFAVVRSYWKPISARAVRGDLRAFDIGLYLLFPTRVMTRSAISAAWLLKLVRGPGLPQPLLTLAMLAEWALPAAIAVRARLVPLSIGGLEAAVRHGLLNLLWFPIGLWALVTPGNRSWDPVPRAAAEEELDAVITTGPAA